MNIECIKQEFRSCGFALITDEYINSKQKFNYICPNGHIGSMRIDHLRRGVGCAECSGNKKLTIDFIRNEFYVNGYRLITSHYINSAQKLRYVCQSNHSGRISWNNWNVGHRCMKCSGKEKHSYNYISKSFSSAGEKLLSKDYNNNKELLDVMCCNGHIYSVSWDNWNSKGVRCSECNCVGVSKAEQELYDFLTIHTENIIKNDRELIKPYEIDLLLEEYKIAIEYCGLYWHSDKFGKGEDYHLNKLILCKEKGYLLITIFEDEWVSKKDIVKGILSGLLVRRKNKHLSVNVTSISIETYKHFSDKNSLFYINKDVDFVVGLFNGYNIIGVAGIRHYYTGLSIDSFVVDKDLYSSKNYIFKNLLEYIDLNFNKEFTMISFDLRWEFYSNEFNNLGFNKNIFIKPKPWFFINNKRRFSSSKGIKCNTIYDCGYINSLRFKDGKGLSDTLLPRFVNDNKDEVLLANLSNF